jgi:hypothetical protein
VYDLKYHLVWITKYRKKVLYGQVAERLRDFLREICKTKDVEVVGQFLAGGIQWRDLNNSIPGIRAGLAGICSPAWQPG